jgi:hypothetical protein
MSQPNMETYLNTEFIPWAEQHLHNYGENNIYGDKLKVRVGRTWVYIEGLKGPGYVYAKVYIKNECMYSASGSKALCRYDDKESWMKIRWPCAPNVTDRHEVWPISRWPPNVREYLRRACNMSDATMCKLVDAVSYDAFADDMFGDDPHKTHESTHFCGINSFLRNHPIIEGATTTALDDWFARKGVNT